jgi:amino acid adenylation domain-containing protein
LAYVIYTSGSTGIPKGAMIEHRGLLNHLHSQISDLALSASDVIAQTAPQSFVISVWQFLAPLMVGARVHVCADEVVRDPALLLREIAREGVTILQVVPALLRSILARSDERAFGALRRLRFLISTGEPLAPDLCRAWFRLVHGVPLLNAYGSAECSDDVATHLLTAPPAARCPVPIGRAIANTRLYVLNCNRQPVPIGAAGELYVGGIGVGRGYLNDPELTRRSFLADPFTRRRGARLYRTGDLARWRADGTLECLGRADHQVKIRGYRIELGEIEHVLLEHPRVAAAVVLARDDLGGEKLVAHIVAATGRQPSANELHAFLKARVPSYMLPGGFIFLASMPLTVHGKLDRRALRAVRRGLRLVEGKYLPPCSPIEKGLAAIWRDLLRIEDIGVLSNFFDLGGHSLLAGQVLARVADEFGVALPIRTLFEAPTIAALARRVEAACPMPCDEPPSAIVRGKADGLQPVSVVQEEILRIERDLPALPQFNLPLAFRLQGPLNVEAFARSLAEVVRRHDALRTNFTWRDGRPFARIAPAAALDWALALEDLGGAASKGSARVKALLVKKAQLLAEQQAWTPFDVRRAPLWRTRLYRLGPDDHVWVLILHHSIVDGWSIDIVVEELSSLYGAFTVGRAAPLRQPAAGLADMARWQRRWCTSDGAARQLAYWQERLRGAAPLFPIADDPGRADLASPTTAEPLEVPGDLVARLGAIGKSQGASLFMTLLAGFKAMLLARSGRGDLCVATAMANRAEQRTERIVGPLENTILIRTRMHLDLSFTEALARVCDAVLEAHANQELPFAILAARLAEADGVDPSPLLQVFFVLQNAFRQRLDLGNVEVHSFGNVYREGEPVLPIDRTWLTVALKQRPSGLTGACSYREDRFEADAGRNWMAEFREILRKIAANPERSLGRLTLG